MRLNLVVLVLIFICFSCARKKEAHIFFYHWKSKAIYTDVIQKALQSTQAKKIYMHYFDVDISKRGNEAGKDLFPIYTLTEVSPEYADFEIIPVVFLVNNALKDADIAALSMRIRSLIDQISNFHFHRQFKVIQLDCDWTSATRDKYFSLINLLKQYYKVNATIRLHQIKYQQQTGIPPVDQGTLMLYNIGHLDSTRENSIIDASIVTDYIHATTSYPIHLDVALPLFSQTVIQSKENQIRIVPGVEKASFEKDTLHFQKVNEHLFKVTHDILYKGFYLSPGYSLKLEEASETEIVASYSALRKSKLNLMNVIFYHLDDDAIQQVNLIRLITQL